MDRIGSYALNSSVPLGHSSTKSMTRSLFVVLDQGKNGTFQEDLTMGQVLLLDGASLLLRGIPYNQPGQKQNQKQKQKNP